MQKWEYCAVHGVWNRSGFRGQSFGTTYPVRWDFTPGGVVETHLPAYITSNEAAALIAKLGEDGWEMVNCVNEEKVYSFFFKRPKEA